MSERDNLVNYLNSLSTDEKDSYWIREEKQMKRSDKDGMIEYTWYYFPNKNIWCCRVYDYDQMREGNGFLKQVVYFKERVDLIQINKQWSVL